LNCCCTLVDALMVHYLKSSIQDGHFIFVATLDEASYQWVMQAVSRNLLSTVRIRKLQWNFINFLAQSKVLGFIQRCRRITQTSVNTNVFGRSPEVCVNEVLLYDVLITLWDSAAWKKT